LNFVDNGVGSADPTPLSTKFKFLTRRGHTRTTPQRGTSRLLAPLGRIGFGERSGTGARQAAARSDPDCAQRNLSASSRRARSLVAPRMVLALFGRATRTGERHRRIVLATTLHDPEQRFLPRVRAQPPRLAWYDHVAIAMTAPTSSRSEPRSRTAGRLSRWLPGRSRRSAPNGHPAGKRRWRVRRVLAQRRSLVPWEPRVFRRAAVALTVCLSFAGGVAYRGTSVRFVTTPAPARYVVQYASYHAS